MLNLTQEEKAKIRNFAAKERRRKEREKIEKIQLEHMNWLNKKREEANKRKTYADYLADKKTITNHIASSDAMPKMTKGDSYRHRAYKKADLEQGFIRKENTLYAGRSNSIVRLK